MIIHFLLLIIVYMIMLITTLRMNKWEKKFLLIRSSTNSTVSTKNFKKKYYLVGFYLVFVILTLFGGLRDWTIGTDTRQYVNSFYIGASYGFEKGYELLVNTLGTLTNSYWIYLTVVQAFILFGVFRSASKYYFSYALFFLLYITSFSYIYSFSALRFFCALSIILIALDYMIRRKTLKVLILIFIASLFHMSALVFIPIYFVTLIKLNLRNTIMLVLMTIATVIFLTIGIDFVFNLNISFLEKYRYIITKESIGIGFSFFINLAVLFLGFYYRPLVKKYKENLDFFLKIQIIATVLDFFPYAYRLIWYFRFPIWFIIPIILLNIRKNGNKFDYIIWYSIISVCYLAYYYIVLKNSLPSHNFLDFKFNTNLY